MKTAIKMIEDKENYYKLEAKNLVRNLLKKCIFRYHLSKGDIAEIVKELDIEFGLDEEMLRADICTR